MLVAAGIKVHDRVIESNRPVDVNDKGFMVFDRLNFADVADWGRGDSVEVRSGLSWGEKAVRSGRVHYVRSEKVSANYPNGVGYVIIKTV